MHSVKETKKEVFFCYMEYESGQGNNKIISVLMNFLKRTKGRASRKKYKLYMLLNSCADQNKNQIMLFLFLNT